MPNTDFAPDFSFLSVIWSRVDSLQIGNTGIGEKLRRWRAIGYTHGAWWYLICGTLIVLFVTNV